jgi:chemotaxis protein histidine kinase CheA
MESELKSLEDHLEQLDKSEKAYDKERLRRLEDLHGELQSAEEANDVVAFIQAQRAAAKDLDRMAKDHAEEVSESQAEFDKTRKERAEEFVKQLADMQTQAEERRTELKAEHDKRMVDMADQFAEERQERQEQYDEQRDQLQKAYELRLKEEKEALKKSLEDAREAFAKRRAEEAEARKVEDADRDEDRRRQLQKMREAHTEQLNQIRLHYIQNLAIVRDSGQELNQIVSIGQKAIQAEYQRGTALTVTSIRDQFLQAMTQPPTSAPTPGGFAGGVGGPMVVIPFQSGGIAMKPMLSVLGEHEPEAVLPLSRLQGMGGGGLGEQTIINIGDVDLGGISEAAFEDRMQRFAKVVVQSVRVAKGGIRVPLQPR